MSANRVLQLASINRSDNTASAIRLQWQMHPTPGPAACYRLAGQLVCADAALAPLAPFASCGEGRTFASQPSPAWDCAADWQMIYQDTAWLGNGWRPLTCWSAACGYRIQAAGMGDFAIDAQGRHAQRLEGEAGAPADRVVELLLGPVLTLALALRGVWCLHASAVTLNGRAVAFLGDSGAGKSTLARFATFQAGADWRRLADDILPVTLAPQGVTAQPRFPQLKLPLHEQAGQDRPQEIALDAVYVLEASQQAAEIAWHPLDTKAAALALVSHTVAARLFDASLLRHHLVFCAEIAATVPVRRLVYPRRLNALSGVLALVAGS